MFLDGSQLVVDYECERILPGWVPRRLGEATLKLTHSLLFLRVVVMATGGGLGGKKESGQLRFGGRERPFKKPM